MIPDLLSRAAPWSIEHGDNLAVLSRLPAGCAHLVYLDPPFFTGRDFKLADGRLAFSDKWPSLNAYLHALLARCVAAWAALSEEGCLIVHADPSVSHHIKVMLDGMLGRERFANEIIWRYRRWPTPTRAFQEMHDVLLRYVRDPKRARWTQLYEPLAPSTLAIHGTKKQRCSWDPATQKSVRGGYEEHDSPGALMCDVWDIPMIAPNGRERTGWPTQKPEALYERLVLALSLPSDLVLEPYCGSGGLSAVAVRHGRRAIAIDSSPDAVEIARARLCDQPTPPSNELQRAAAPMPCRAPTLLPTTRTTV